MISQLEFADQQMRENGLCDDWFRDVAPEVRTVSGSANGPLLQQLLTAAGYHDVECVEMLREGES